MSRTWKVVLLAVLVLPVLAYAAGALTVASPEDPRPRPAIVIEDPHGDVFPGQTLRPSPTPPSPSPSNDEDDDEGDDDGDDDGDDEITVIRPEIGEDDDDDDGRRRRRRRDDDTDDDSDDGDDD